MTIVPYKFLGRKETITVLNKKNEDESSIFGDLEKKLGNCSDDSDQVDNIDKGCLSHEVDSNNHKPIAIDCEEKQGNNSDAVFESTKSLQKKIIAPQRNERDRYASVKMKGELGKRNFEKISKAFKSYKFFNKGDKEEENDVNESPVKFKSYYKENKKVDVFNNELVKLSKNNLEDGDKGQTPYKHKSMYRDRNRKKFID